MSRLVSSPQAVLGFASSSRSFREKIEAARSASGGIKRGCKRFGEVLSVASGPAFVIEKSHTLPRSRGGWNLDLSRAGVVNPGGACGDDEKASPINGLRRKPPSAMMMTRPPTPACVQISTFSDNVLISQSCHLFIGPSIKPPSLQRQILSQVVASILKSGVPASHRFVEHTPHAEDLQSKFDLSQLPPHHFKPIRLLRLRLSGFNLRSYKFF